MSTIYLKDSRVGARRRLEYVSRHGIDLKCLLESNAIILAQLNFIIGRQKREDGGVKESNYDLARDDCVFLGTTASKFSWRKS